MKLLMNVEKDLKAKSNLKLYENMLKIKSVFDSIEEDDGLRILATRFRGRGLSKDLCDVWMANLGPTEKTLKAFQADKMSWEEFSKQYEKELYYSFNLDKRNNTIFNHGQKFTLRLLKKLSEEQNITLMCHCETGNPLCHVGILKKMIEKS